MSQNITNLPRGQAILAGNGRTLSTGMRPDLEGIQTEFQDIAPGQASGVKVVRSSRFVKAIMLQNISGVTLEAGRAVSYASGQRGRRVDGYSTVSVGPVAGIVDPHYGATGVADDDYFWCLYEGPAECKTDLAAGAGNVISLDDLMVAMTAVTSQSTTSGRVVAQAATTSTTYIMSVPLNAIGRALSAKTTANTNADVLVDLACSLK